MGGVFIMSTYSIWGEAQTVDHLCRGVRSVSTASHGGLLVSKRFAEKHIPKKVLANIPFEQNCYQFEEDCAYSIPMMFKPSLIENLMKAQNPLSDEDDLLAKIKRFAANIYSAFVRWYPEYASTYQSAIDEFKLYCKYTLNFNDTEMNDMLNIEQ
jgi:hypothetical protein